jgi:hypothetical protein
MNTMPMPREFEEMAEKWKKENKPSKVAASFTKVSELQEIHLKHFRNAPYLWKPINGSIFGGLLMDDSLDYIHLVLVNEEVLNYILNLKKEIV